MCIFTQLLLIACGNNQPEVEPVTEPESFDQEPTAIPNFEVIPDNLQDEHGVPNNSPYGDPDQDCVTNDLEDLYNLDRFNPMSDGHRPDADVMIELGVFGEAYLCDKVPKFPPSNLNPDGDLTFDNVTKSKFIF